MTSPVSRSHYRVPMRSRALATAIVVSVGLLTTPWAPAAGAQEGGVAPVPGGAQPTPFDAGQAAAQAPVTAEADGGSGLTPSGAGTGTFASFKVYATQYIPNTPGSVEVAVPDKCAKFAALGWTGPLANQGCPSGYRLGLDYSVDVRRDSGQSATIPVREVGPWNVDDNYWAGPGSPRPRRMFTDLARGVPEAQAARSGYNTRPCNNLNGTPSGRSAGADQFNRCVLNPAGIDLSVEAAKRLGLGNLQNEVVTVTFRWEPLATTLTSVNSGKLLDIEGASTADGARALQWASHGGANQQWKFIPAGPAGVYIVLAAHSGKALDIEGGSTQDGARALQWSRHGGANQRWRVIPVSGGYRLVAEHSGKALDVAAASRDDGAPVLQWSPHGGANQVWRLSVVG